VLIPSSLGAEAAIEIAGVLDGILLTGGGDVDPAYFGEAPDPDLRTIDPLRDATEIALCRHALGLGMPLLGICRGIQTLAVALQGTVIQHLDRENTPGLIQHEIVTVSPGAGHEIAIEPGSIVHRIVGRERISVTSAHHQAVGEPGEGMAVTARTADGVIEAIEHGEHPFLVGVEWHPEREPAGSPAGLPVIRALVTAAGGRE
jgi:putative glutamine amidotransferase